METKFKFLLDGERIWKKIKELLYSERIIPDIKNARNLSKKELKEKEGRLILDSLKNSNYVILLDDKGITLSSIEFSAFINQKMVARTNELVFVVGGAFGFSESVYKRANTRLSLSKMTFSHQMVRIFLKEQIYRAFTILNGEKYHH